MQILNQPQLWRHILAFQPNLFGRDIADSGGDFVKGESFGTGNHCKTMAIELPAPQPQQQILQRWLGGSELGQSTCIIC
jgi:hypothetical protein